MRSRCSGYLLLGLTIFVLMFFLCNLGPVAGQNSIIDITPMTVISSVSEDGQDVANIKLDEAQVLDLVYNKESIRGLEIRISSLYEKLYLEISSELTKNLTAKQLPLYLKTQSGTFIFDAAKLKLGLSPKGIINPNNNKLRITAGKIGVSESEKLDGILQERPLNKVEFVIFSIESVDDSGRGQWIDSTEYVTHTLILPKEVNARYTVGAVLTEDGTFFPVPTRFFVEDDKNVAVIKIRNSGIFALVRSDKYFSDISTHWAENTIDLLSSKLILNGVQKELFNPDAKVARAEFATVIVRALGLGSVTEERIKFRDVKASDWYYPYVVAVVEAGAMRGYPGELFKPGAFLTREQIAVIVTQALEAVGQPLTMDSVEVEQVLSNFKDQKHISSWARRGIAAAVKSGIIKGISSGQFAPQQNCTRAEMAVMLRRMMMNAGLISPSIMVDSPVENLNTNKNTVDVGGKVKPGNRLTVNAENASIESDGSFKIPLKLRLGINTIPLIDEELAGKKDITVITIVYDDKPPELAISSPMDKSVVEREQVDVTGKSEPGCIIKINNLYTTFTNNVGNFNASIPLKPGRNMLLITATDAAGNVSTVKWVVFSSPNTISNVTVKPEVMKLGTLVNIRYFLERDAYVATVVYSESGEYISTLQNNQFAYSGNQTTSWDGKDITRKLVPDGKYRLVFKARNSEGRVLATVEKNITAARQPLVNPEIYGLPVFTPTEKEGISLPFTVSHASNVTVAVLKGRTPVKILVDDAYMKAGYHSITWDAKDEKGSFLGDGVYTCRISIESTEVAQFKSKTEFDFVIEREIPRIENVNVNPDPLRINGLGLNIRYHLSEYAHVTVKILDKNDKQVLALLNNQTQDGGNHNLSWNGTNNTGLPVSEDIYKVVITSVDNFQKRSEIITKLITVGYQPMLSNVRFSPAPFRPAVGKNATISYSLSHEAIVNIEIKVYWVTVKNLIVNTRQAAGAHTIRWDGSDDQGYLVGEGLYTIEIKAVSPTVQNFKTSYMLNIDIKDPVSIEDQEPVLPKN